MIKRKMTFAIGLVVMVGLWYAFRPELFFVTREVNERFPSLGEAGGAMAVAKGNFRSLAHETRGTATIYRLADGKQTLRLADFETSNGPDVHVYLSAAQIEKGSDAIKTAGFIDLGSMKGNKGEQNYDIPANTDLTKYRYATIWCARFGVNFGTAPLS